MKQLFATSILAASLITVCSMCSTGTDNNYKKAIFVTESTYTGDLYSAAKGLNYKGESNTVAVADYLCNQEAQKLGYSGGFKALINTSKESSNAYSNVISQSESTPYYNIIESGKLESTVLATSVKLDLNKPTAIRLTFTSGAKFFNRGESSNWVGSATADCKGWTSNLNTESVVAGSGKDSDTWDKLNTGKNTKCDQKASLVCVQQ